MADLLPTLSSDDEGDNGNDDRDDDDEDDDKDIAMNKDFQFGGILGEDGSFVSVRQKGWSYQSTLNAMDPEAVARTDIGAIIAAKRNLILKNKKGIPEKKSKMDEEKEEEEQEEDDDDDSSSDDENGNEDQNDDDDDDDRNDEDDDDDDDDDDEEEEEEDEVDDVNEEMEEDVLKTRAGRERKSRASVKEIEATNNNNDDDMEKEEEEQNDDEQEEEDEEEVENEEEEVGENDDDDDEDDDEDLTEKKKAAKFFDDSHNRSSSNADIDDIQVFAQLTLSRPLLLGVAAMGFVKPTPIQAKVIPIALMGRDVCASAVTGSGKTAAFLLPICERLLHRASNNTAGGRIKAVILTPTRELAAQCVGMLASLTQHCPNLRSTLIVGGSKNVAAQASELRIRRPSIVVATPGRLLDHVTNSVGVSLEDVEFLVLDEADRLLDLGFQEEVHELVKTCPKERQTMLFSATMTTKVDELIKLSLKRPVRVHITESSKNGGSNSNNGSIEVAPRLEQEFVRVRAGNEGLNREAMLLALLTRTFTRHSIVFFDTKANAHRLMILCGLCGIRCAELHGNLSQAQRLTALEQFRQGEVDILLATDLAARGLDIDRVECVINFEMPSQVETYVHRIGRTARAGRGGKSCTLIGEGRRHLMKEVIKDADEKKKRSNSNNNNKAVVAGPTQNSSGVIRSRTIPPAVITHFVAKIQSLEEHVKEVIQAEEVAKMDRIAEMEATRAQNIISHSDEIHGRPQREWFASKRQKETTKLSAAEKHKMIEEKAGTGTHRMSRKKRRAREARDAMDSANPQDDAAAADDDEPHNKKKKVVTDKSIKASVRTQKKKKEIKDKELIGRSVHEEDQLLQQQQQQRKSSKVKRKGAFASDAAGDSSLFDDERVAYANKKPKQDDDKDRPAPSSFHFKGYDPNKVVAKKSKKKSAHHAFKSKSKFKRR